MDFFPLVTLAVLAFHADPQIPPLAQQLGSPLFKTRQTASQKLKGLGARALPLLSCYEGHADAEVRKRSHVLCQAWRDEFYSVLPANYHMLPWLDMLDPERFVCTRGMKEPACIAVGDLKTGSQIYGHYSGIAWREGHGNRNPTWASDRRATELYVADLLAQGTSPAAIRRLMESMVPIERRWREVVLKERRVWE